MKLPGIYALYAAFIGVGGHSAASVHAGLLVANALSTLLCFWIGRRLFGALAGAVASVAYAALSLSPAMLGLAAHAESFSVAFALGGLWVLLPAIDRRRAGACFASGLLVGTALVIKQNGAAFAAFSIAWVAGATLRVAAKERARML
ncbi:MAG: glycosyltransferase family 39 protein, partial [Solirubrobacteraceae bacterium]